jgi:hypothetical protein
MTWASLLDDWLNAILRELRNLLIKVCEIPVDIELSLIEILAAGDLLRSSDQRLLRLWRHHRSIRFQQPNY